MHYSPLGQTGISVSRLCLGTMTWGEQNNEQQAHQQLDTAIDAGINFIDTAEMYPVPPRSKTFGLTEQYIGTWLRKRNDRDKIILASKVVGPAPDLAYIRDGKTRLDRNNIEAALNGSLKRLQTDYLDLYQLHWPDRNTNYFGQLGYQHEDDESAVPIDETLRVMSDLVDAGKIRYIGLSNETPWGTMTFLNLSETLGLHRVVSIQNPYNLLNRTFEIGLAEIAHREHLGLLAYSPLAFGVLSGKYLGGRSPTDARLTLFERFKRYTNPQADYAVAKYVAIAQKYGIDPAQMALAFINSRPFLTSNIIGATTLQQLGTNLDSINIELTVEVINEIAAIHAHQPNPSP